MESKCKNHSNFRRNIYMYLLLVPAILIVFFMQYVPMLGIMISFKDFDVLKGFAASPWVGLKNYTYVFSNPKFLFAIKNTLIYSSVLMFGSFPFPIILALMFNEVRNAPFKKISQTITYMPHFLSWTSVIGMVNMLFAMYGPVNNVLASLFGESFVRTNILFSSKSFLGILYFSNLWKSIGWSSIIYLAAIAGIDPSLYEAATIDGCGKLRQIIYITLPGIAATAVLILVMGLGGLVNMNFELVYGFQNVYTQEQTEVINTLIYRQGIVNGNYSASTAFGISQGIVSLMLVVVANFVAKKTANISIW